MNMQVCPESTGKPFLLVVDDALNNIQLLISMLSPHYNVTATDNGVSALRLAAAHPQPDLILLDVAMPDMDGYEVCRRLKTEASTHDIPVMFLTANIGSENEYTGLALGAVDYLTKSPHPEILLAKIKIHLALKAHADSLRDKSHFLESQNDRLQLALESMRDAAIQAIASIARVRDTETGNHICRTQWYVKQLAIQLSTHPKFSAALPPQAIELMFKSASLHDIGKVGIRDSILLKPGKLNAAEFEIMKTHTTLGREVIEHAEKQLGSRIDFLAVAKEIAYSHHERWDGTGYPQGLSGEAIPLSARIMAVADVYDALTSRRVYKDSMPHQEAANLIVQGKGKHFDPDVTDAFLAIQDEFKAIAQGFTD